MEQQDFLARYGEQFEAFLKTLRQSTEMLEAVGDTPHGSACPTQLEEALDALPGWVLRKAGRLGERKGELEQE